jgi:hypothetical protein
MAHKFGPRIERLMEGIEEEPTASELLNQLQRKLRDVEKAQIAAAQKSKEVIPPGVTRGSRHMSNIWQQIEAARRSGK